MSALRHCLFPYGEIQKDSGRAATSTIKKKFAALVQVLYEERTDIIFMYFIEKGTDMYDVTKL
jgi:hypothetical protein